MLFKSHLSLVKAEACPVGIKGICPWWVKSGRALGPPLCFCHWWKNHWGKWKKQSPIWPGVCCFPIVIISLWNSKIAFNIRVLNTIKESSHLSDNFLKRIRFCFRAEVTKVYLGVFKVALNMSWMESVFSIPKYLALIIKTSKTIRKISNYSPFNY